jgi:hypothetical protein
MSLPSVTTIIRNETAAPHNQLAIMIMHTPIAMLMTPCTGAASDITPPSTYSNPKMNVAIDTNFIAFDVPLNTSLSLMSNSCSFGITTSP